MIGIDSDMLWSITLPFLSSLLNPMKIIPVMAFLGREGAGIT